MAEQKENNFNQSNDNIVPERSNINVNKTYMTSQNFLIGASLISIFVMNILLAMYMIKSQEKEEVYLERSIVEIKKDVSQKQSKLEKDILEKIEIQNDLISSFIESNRR